MIKQKNLILLLLLSNLITLSLLIALITFYRVPQKAYRQLVGESRVPIVTANHEMNRFYTSSRKLFDSYPVTEIRSLVVGDSQVSLVNWNELLEGYDAVGRGINGDTVSGLAARITDYRTIQPEICVVIIGTNDILKDRSLSETKNAYQMLVNTAVQSWPTTEIVLVSVPPFSSWVTNAKEKNNRVTQTNQLIANLADQSSRIHYLNLHDAVKDHYGYLAKIMTMDGVHLSAVAYSILRNKLMSVM